MASLTCSVRGRGRRGALRALVFPGLVALGLAAMGDRAGWAQPAPPAQDCDRAAWPLGADRARLSAPGLGSVAPGEVLVLPFDGALRLTLVPQAEANLPVPPRKAQEEAFAGVVGLKLPSPEQVWQVTVSANAWIDVVVDGRALTPVAFTGVHACPGVRKSLRFRIPGGDARLQVSGVQDMSLDFLVTPVN